MSSNRGPLHNLLAPMPEGGGGGTSSGKAENEPSPTTAKEMSRTSLSFKRKLEEASSVTLNLKRKLLKEEPLRKKTGYLLSTEKEAIALLAADLDGEKGQCCKVAEAAILHRKPLDYHLLNTEAEEILSVTGLSEDSPNESVVKCPLLETDADADASSLGIISYNHMGAGGEHLSRVTQHAGRSKSSLVPTTVQRGADGVLLYVFKSDQEDRPNNVQVMTADGNGKLVAELSLKIKRKDNKSTEEPAPKGKKGGQSFGYKISIKFTDTGVGFSEKMLIIGVTIALFHKFIGEKQSKGICRRCSII